jgi:hypothetical protein
MWLLSVDICISSADACGRGMLLNMLTTILYLVIALCLIGTVIWAFQKYITIPGPFAWAKGVITFILIVLACYFIWDQVFGGRLLSHHLR